MNLGPRSSGRVVVGLGVIALMAVLVWRTMEPGKYQQLTWLLLGFFAVRVLFARQRTGKIGQ